MPQPDPPAADPVDLLDGLLHELLAYGVSHAADLVATDPGQALTDLLCPPAQGAGSRHDRAIRAHRVLVAAVAALGRPATPALEALLDLHPAARPVSRRAPLTRTERREQAGTYYRVTSETVRRHHEDRLIHRLAVELYQRAHLGEATTHATDPQPDHTPPPADRFPTAGPPPPSQYPAPAGERVAGVDRP
ncbi:hypothetical protein [Pseudofrankia sp. DC12]|uniref:hypothetical protein n=1 Tax=Pseudofrankia sp. DC12 TaxID=683315 RepID=UPI0005F7DEC2|nr:hypothetical protein [Pseudofrankia sp. DC12]